jgi:hypothetical protein
MDEIKQLEQRLLDDYLEGLERERAEKDSGGSKNTIKPGAGSTNSVPRIRGTPINPKLIPNVAFILRQDSAKKVFSASFSASTGVPSRSVLNLVSVLRRDCSRISVDARKQFFSDSVRRAALRNGLDPLLLQKVCQHESGWNPFAVYKNDNGTYDFGLFQLNSATLADAYARGVKVNPFNVEESADFAAKHLAHLINVFGDSSLAVVAYNRGEGKVRKWLRRGLSTEEILNIVRNAAYHRSVLSQKV